jgi:hypothetical protein
MGYHYENNELTYVANVCAMLSAVSREYAERFPERHHPGPRQLLI